jgi:FdhD protein
VRSLEIQRIAFGERSVVQDLITEEIALTLLVESRRVATLLCSPADLEDLVRGFLYCSQIVTRGDQVRQVVVNRAGASAFVALDPGIDLDGLPLQGLVGSACGSLAPAGGGEGPEEPLPPSPRLSAEQIMGLMQELDRRSELHRRTGGVHAAALASPSGILVFREDIGRHNAVDKAVGAWLGREGGFADKILLCSGRLSSEILSKALRCRIPVLVSRSAPTDRGVALARRFNLTLVGFARGRRLNIYSGAERIVSPQS